MAFKKIVPAMIGMVRSDREDPTYRARRTAERIKGCLEASQTGGVYNGMVGQICDVVGTRLPRLVETRDRLGSYLKLTRREQIERQVGALNIELSDTTDPDLRRIVERNMQLARERLVSHARITLLHSRAEAQIQNVLLTLDNLEDRVVSVKLTPNDGNLAPELEAMLAEVQALEVEYRKLHLLE